MYVFSWVNAGIYNNGLFFEQINQIGDFYNTVEVKSLCIETVIFIRTTLINEWITYNTWTLTSINRRRTTNFRSRLKFNPLSK